METPKWTEFGYVGKDTNGIYRVYRLMTCHQCAGEFFSRYAGAKYCSGKCRMAAHRERNKVDTRCYCQWCGRAFIAKRGDAKYDTRACQQAAYRARRKAGKQLMF
jgi:hypothetical protein